MKRRQVRTSTPRLGFGMFVATLLLFAAGVTGCSKVDDDHALPPGKHPINFTAAVDGLTVEKAGTRATTTNGWTGGEEVAVKIDSEVKKYTAATDGTLTVDGSDVAPWYWQNTTETKTVSAWYPHSATQPTSFTVQTNQSGDGYQSSDMIYAAPTPISFRSNALTFRHLPAKVVVNLKNGEGVTESDVQNATVTIVNQAISGTIAANWSVAQTTPGSSTITANVLSSAASGYQQSMQALLVPQQMQNQKFIKVTISGNNYYYTPTGENDANLESGKQYTYAITVKKDKLAVVVTDNGVAWTDNQLSDGTAEKASFYINLPAFTAPANTSNYQVKNSNGTLMPSDGVYSITDNTFDVTLSANDNYLLSKFLLKVTAGICKQKVTYTSASRTYTYTFYDIRSDLWLKVPEVEAVPTNAKQTPQVGDYYYADGTWSATKAEGKTCIGIVFKVGVAGNDAIENYSYFFNGGVINGYVVALQDASQSSGTWGTRGIDTPLPNVDQSVTAYTGYTDTRTIADTYSSTPVWNNYWAFKTSMEYRSSVPAPAVSSGWYLPSLAQQGDVYNALSTIGSNLTTAGGTAFKTGSGESYWTSSEKENRGWDAWFVTMNNGGKDAHSKDTSNGGWARYVRAILTF